VKNYQSKITKKIRIGPDITLVETDKPKGFKFQAGQFVKLALPQLDNQPDNGNWRWLSLASAPYEKKLLYLYLEGPSDFKKKLEAGRPVAISQPLGNFQPPQSADQPVVFLAGGVGIAPIRSIILQAIQKKDSRPMWLFYSNSQPARTAFLAEFENLKNPAFHFVPTMSKPETASDWSGEKGRISLPMLKRHLEDYQHSTYLVVGSPNFVGDMVKMLEKSGVSQINIQTEKFIGL